MRDRLNGPHADPRCPEAQTREGFFVFCCTLSRGASPDKREREETKAREKRENFEVGRRKKRDEYFRVQLS